MLSVQGQKKQRAKKSVIGIEKERERAERMKNRAMMKAEQAQKKAVKMAAAEAYRSKKPGECLKVSGYFTFKSVLTLMLQWLAKF